tara:strand:- start:144 stop:263 length:120 start_codon:yes stop_codon:yes gene_type:complete
LLIFIAGLIDLFICDNVVEGWIGTAARGVRPDGQNKEII